MSVSEIEGDAILFYKYRDIPSMHKILSQVREVFLNFHNHLKHFENKRICQCGACSSAVELKLKFIVHSGDLEFINIKDHKKLYGPDVILAHKLLKNSVQEKEYVLLTNNICNDTSGQDIKIFHKWARINTGKTNYDKIGNVNYKYISLNPLHDFVNIPPAVIPFPKIKNPIFIEGFIKRTVDVVFEVVTNFEYRLKWNKDIDKIIYDKEKVNRIGTKHRCVIGSQNLDIETVGNNFGDDKLVFGERIVKARMYSIPVVKEFTVYYIISKDRGGTNLRIEVHFISFRILCIFITPLFKSFMKKNINKLFNSLKEVCEDYD
jgi:hypothetical protein